MEDRLLKAIHDLRHVLQKTKNIKGDLDFQAIKDIDTIINSRNDDATAPRVDAPTPRAETPELADPDTHPNLRAAQQQAIDASAPRVNEPETTNTGPASNTRSTARRKAIEHCAQILVKELSAQIEDPKTKIEIKGVRELINSVMDLETGKMLSYRDLLKHPKLGPDWNVLVANEFGRLAQGVGNRIKGTNTIKFINKEDVPSDRQKDVTYAGFVCKV